MKIRVWIWAKKKHFYLLKSFEVLKPHEKGKKKNRTASRTQQINHEGGCVCVCVYRYRGGGGEEEEEW